MEMIIAVASGKGGTGKTTVAVNLAKVLPGPVQLLDCDVEEPNAHLFLHGELKEQKVVSIPVPEVDEVFCDGCGECGRFCRYHAIVSLKTEPLIFPELCHGCGGCVRVCPIEAIRERDRRIGVVERLRSGDITLLQGRLDVGESMAPPLIRAVKARIRPGVPAILDAPPGTSCPVITTLRGADFIVLVTEPTPFGLHDLKLAVESIRQMAIPFGVVINRVGAGDDRVHAYCKAGRIPILLEIPDDRRIAEAYSRGDLLVEALPEYREHFLNLGRRILSKREILHRSRLEAATAAMI
ncbi:MAG: ferredoxin [Syntrophaceae bacterium PtaU1.Bin231]|nr:MAG: ferredoxin [Syntrophaceae bacterium PtaU1.Bin231]